ncbi:uncharacterized protein FSUBG_985 [Fusarium subglutinans]|uniref:BTB domain-containing protein n=1 Tax=Gibberella subglutinans TaxID=42677 RepID=A0A8H5QBD1_GIBSU|nr:uncharacterized protein FSUBG_985 [Fusarium subglutinans]KAF5613255.1 hypothetical protein FSUBG_985 [Fusarium subglutinans]
METVANQVAAQEAEEVEDLGPWTVVPGGDVMLVVGARKVQILVSASFLSHVSVMFEKMFSGGMKEGNSLTNRVDGQQARIELIDDNPEATYHALKILYGSDPGSFKLPPRTIRDVSIFADKADMVQRFKPICSLWLETAPGSVDKPSLQAGFDLLVASYWFDHGEGFFIMSQFFVRTDIPLLEFALELGDEPLGLRLALAIEELRLANAYRNETIGLCLDCFVAATKNFVAQQPGCRRTRRHLVL